MRRRGSGGDLLMVTQRLNAMNKDKPGIVVLPPLLYAGALVVMFMLRWFWQMPITTHAFLLWPGLGLIVLGIGIGVWGRRMLLLAGTNVNPLRPTTAIVTSGPYRFTRNPLYCGLTLVFCGVTLACNTWWGFVVLLPLVLIMHFGVVLREERYLKQKFGETYQQYCTQVRRYF